MSLPLVRRLPKDFSIVEAFERLRNRRGCLWLDSSSRGPQDTRSLSELGRYSFITADPVDTLEVFVDGPDPWPQLARWCDQLPTDHDPSLPPFQGGIAGLIGYEAGAWLEPVGLAALNDLPTPTVSLGIYDWTIAVDHHSGESWLISQGLRGSDRADRLRLADQRADQVETWIGSSAEYPHPEATGTAIASNPKPVRGTRRRRKPNASSATSPVKTFAQVLRRSSGEFVRVIPSRSISLKG